MTNRLYIFLCTLCSIGIISCSREDLPFGNKETEGIDYEVEEEFETNTQEVTFENEVTIAFSSGTASVNNPYASQGISIQVEGDHVIIDSSAQNGDIQYVLSGNTTNGSVKIYSDYAFGLVLNGVSIINEDGPALNIQSGKKASVLLVEYTANRLVDSKTYTDNTTEDRKGAFFSEGQLIFTGKGSLEVVGRRKHGICSDDYIEVQEGSIKVSAAASDGLHANEYIRLDGGTIDLHVQGEGIECEKGYLIVNGGNLSIVTTGEKGHGLKSSGDCTINYCEQMNITVKGNGSKGFKTGGNLHIVNGAIEITATGDAFYDSDDKDITSPAGLKCDGNCTIDKATLVLTCTGSAGKGINTGGTSVFNNPAITVTTSGKQFTYNRESSSAKAIKSTGDLTVNDGTYRIKTSTNGAEGMESKATLTINGGQIEIEAYDNCLNASRHIQVNGGQIYCYSTGNDGVDSSGTLTVTGGLIIASGTSSPEDGFDCDNNTFKITGGVLIGTGGSTSTPTSSACTQYSLIWGTSGTASQLIHIQSASGEQILTYQVPRSYNQMTFLYSSPSLEWNQNYTIYTGGSITGANDFHGYYTGGTYSGGTSSQTFTTTSLVTSIGNSSGGIGGSGPGFGGRW